MISGGEFKPPVPKLKEGPTSASSLLSVKIEAKNLVPRYSARVITDITVDSSPQWMQERLITCGLRPINIVVDVTNYMMLETGQPLHAFDYDRLSGGVKKQIIVRVAKKGEVVETLGDETQKLILTSDDIVIADTGHILGLGGIKGGKGSEIHRGTKRIILEAANFSPVAIRKTSKRLNLRTDASWRFEHNLDLEMTISALNRAAELICQYAGGRVTKGVVDVVTKKEPLRVIPLTLARVDALLGISVPEAAATSILRRLGCEIKKKKSGLFQVIPPTFRRDLNIEEDLIEEVARIWGYDKIPAVLPIIRGGIAKKSDRQIFEDALKDRLVGFGFIESHLSAFIGERALLLFHIPPGVHYHLENPTSPETTMLTRRIDFQYIRSVAENLYQHDSVKIFGIGKNFIKDPNYPIEERRLIIALAERGRDGTEEFYELKGVVDALLESFGISDHTYDDDPDAQTRAPNWAHPGRLAEIIVDRRDSDRSIGVIAELSHEFTVAIKSRARIAIADINIERLLSEIETEQEFRPIAKFPAIVRDIALIIPESARIQEVEDTIQNAGSSLLVDSDLFDYYEGKGMKEGAKSVAFHLVFQSEERTLTDKEVDHELEKIVKAVKAKGWEVR